MKDVKTFFNKLNNYSRSDLSERPNQWPDRAERIETTAKELGHALQVFNKRLNACMASDSRYDNVKRLRKMKESKYAEAMAQVASQFTCSYLLNMAFRSLGDVGQELAEERFNYELTVDQIVAYFREVELTVLPTLAKHRKHLARACADLRLAKEKLRHVESLRPEPAKAAEWQTKKEDCQRRVQEQERRVTEQEKVTLSHLFSFDHECHAYSANLTALLKQLGSYHRKCLLILEEKLPGIEKDITDRSFSPVFECSLMQHLEESKREIAFPIEMCVQALNTEEALQEEGLFRLAGAKVKVDVLKRAFNSMSDDVEGLLLSTDAHSIADTLKQYLRGLPDPLLKAALFNDWSDATKITDRDARRIALQSCLMKLPQDHFINLKYLIGYLYRVSQFSSVNKMTARNLGIVLGPTLLWKKPSPVVNEAESEPSAADGEMKETSVPNDVVANLIEYAPRFFPDGDLMLSVSTGFGLRSSRRGGSMTGLNTTGRRASIPDSPYYPVSRGAPMTSTLGMRRWPAAGSSSAIFSSMREARRPGSMTPTTQRWAAHDTSSQAWSQDNSRSRRYASMSSIDTRTSAVGENVVLDISQPSDFRRRTAMGRGSSTTQVSKQTTQQSQHGVTTQSQQRGSSIPRQLDGWRGAEATTTHVTERTERRRYTSQQDLHADGTVRVQAVPITTTTTVLQTNRREAKPVVRRAESVDAIRKNERTVLEVQVNGNAKFQHRPIEVTIRPEKGETKL